MKNAQRSPGREAFHNARVRAVLFACAGSIGLVLGGCGRREAPIFPRWASPSVQVTPRTGSDNAYDWYVLAAARVEHDAPKQLGRVWFTPDQKSSAISQTRTALKLVSEGAKRNCTFLFSSRAPFDPAAHENAWRLLGHTMMWRIQESCASLDYAQAVADVILATKLGFDLTGGSAIDAATGLGIVDEARVAIAPSLSKLPPAGLRSLSSGIKAAMLRRPPTRVVLAHEREDMLQGVQVLQDAYLEDHLDPIAQKLGPDAAPSLGYLKDLKNQDSRKAMNLFAQLADEANRECAYTTQLTVLPRSQRGGVPEPKLPRERPLKHLDRFLFGAARPLLAIQDVTIARTRLLILEAELMRRQKTEHEVPMNLSGFTKALTIDPFTGQPFHYRSNGTDYEIYSVGANLVDDGGVTDESYASPDLKLERPAS